MSPGEVNVKKLQLSPVKPLGSILSTGSNEQSTLYYKT